MTAMAWTYLAYLTVCVGITIWVARTLRKHGRVFLTRGDDLRGELSDALSHLLVVGFYLVNFGVISFALKIDGRADDAQTAIELVSTKIGTILVVLGFMHFLILTVFSKVRRSADDDERENNHRSAIHDVASSMARTDRY